MRYLIDIYKAGKEGQRVKTLLTEINSLHFLSFYIYFLAWGNFSFQTCNDAQYTVKQFFEY